MVIRSLTFLRHEAGQHSAGYFEAVCAAGKIESQELFIDPVAYLALRQKFAPKRIGAFVPAVPLVLSPASPTLPELALNFLAATARWITAGFPIVHRALFDQRVAVCKTCPEWLGDALVPRCRKCGCTALKPWLATEKCPLGNW